MKPPKSTNRSETDISDRVKPTKSTVCLRHRRFGGTPGGQTVGQETPPQTRDRPRRVGIANAFRTAILNLKRSGSEGADQIARGLAFSSLNELVKRDSAAHQAKSAAPIPPTLITTNGFVIRDSANASNRDKHLAEPSNDSLTAVCSCSVPLAAWNTPIDAPRACSLDHSQEVSP